MDRSISKHQLIYSTSIGDRDSSSFKRQVQSDPYNGSEFIRKEECLGHVQKHLKRYDNYLKKKLGRAISIEKIERIVQLYQPCSTFWITCFRNIPTAPQRSIRASITNADVRRMQRIHRLKCVGGIRGIFSNISLCSPLSMEKTRNSHEFLHSIIWHKTHKIKFVGN